MDFLELMNKHNLTRKAVSDRFGIPYRTVQNWALGTNKCQEYIMNMMEEILRKEEQLYVIDTSEGIEYDPEFIANADLLTTTMIEEDAVK